MITITNKIITPMLRLVVEWEPVTSATTYRVKVRESDAVSVVTENTTTNPHRFGTALRNATWHFVQVLAYNGPTLLDSSTVETFWTAAQGGTAPLLRQAVYDALFEADLDVVDDNYFRPRAWGRIAAPNAVLPVTEIGMPSLNGTDSFSSEAKLYNWQVPINTIISHDLQDPDRDSSAWLLWEMVQGAVDQSDGLHLTNMGVLPEQWSWSASLATKSRSKTTMIEATLTVPVRTPTGVILIPQPSTIPSEPTPPSNL